MGAVDIRDRFVNLINAVVSICENVRRSMIRIVSVETAALELQFICLLKMILKLWPCLMIIHEIVLFEDSCCEEAS